MLLTRQTLVLGLGCALAATLPWCEARAADADRPVQVAIQVAPTMRTSTLVGMTVKNPRGVDVGRVEDLAIDFGTGRVRYAILSFGGWLGLGEKLFPIPWSEVALHYHERDAYLVVDVEPSFLKRVPSFTRHEWPEMTAEWIRTLDAIFPTHSGLVVAVEPDRLTMTYLDGKSQHAHPVAKNAKVLRDGQVVALTALEQGDEITIRTEEQAGIRVVTRIDARSRH